MFKSWTKNLSVALGHLKRLNQLPLLMRCGFMVLALGGSLDVIYHAAPVSQVGYLEQYVGRDAYLAHLVTFIGMVVSLIGVLSKRFRFVVPRRDSEHPTVH